MSDPFTSYETGLKRLLERLGSDHPRYADALVYQQRLQENIAQARQYGDTETRRAERVQILDSLNRITQESLNMPFNALCESAIQQTGEIHITPSVTATPLIDIYSDREDWLNLPDSSYATTLPGSTSSLPNVQEWLYSNLLPIVEHPTIIYSATGSQSYGSLSSWCGQEGSGTFDRTQPYLCASIRYLHCQGESNAYAQ
jgi:hypothetical protein